MSCAAIANQSEVAFIYIRQSYLYLHELFLTSKKNLQRIKQEAFEKCWAHSPLRAVLHCHSPGVATVARRLRIDVHDNDNNNDNDNA